MKSVEVEGLKKLLLPHFRVCGDELEVAYLDELGGLGGAWGGNMSEVGSGVRLLALGKGWVFENADEE